MPPSPPSLPPSSSLKVGQWKRLYGKDTLGVWQELMPIDQGAAKLHAAYPWERTPLLPGHIDGLSVPPGLLHDAPLQTVSPPSLPPSLPSPPPLASFVCFLSLPSWPRMLTRHFLPPSRPPPPPSLPPSLQTYLSMFMDSLNAPFPLIYEKDVTRRGIPLKRFVFHPDSFSQKRPDAAVFSKVGREGGRTGRREGGRRTSTFYFPVDIALEILATTGTSTHHFFLPPSLPHALTPSPLARLTPRPPWSCSRR